MNKPYEVLQDSTKTESSPLNKDMSCDANIPDLDEILEYQETIEEEEDNDIDEKEKFLPKTFGPIQIWSHFHSKCKNQAVCQR